MADLATTLLRGRKLLAALRSPLGRRALSSRVAATIEHMDLLRTLAPASIVDVGANRGQFALAALYAVPGVRLVCFEPGRRAYETLRRTVGDHPRVRTVKAAIAEQAGELVLNVTEADDSSSLLPVGEAQAELFGTRVAAHETIEAGPLDAFVAAAELEAPALLKVDVQGFERGVIAGASSRLACFRWVYIESSFIELYVGQMLAPELVTVMEAAGFELAGVFNQVGSRQIPAIQADFLFARRDRGGEGT